MCNWSWHAIMRIHLHADPCKPTPIHCLHLPLLNDLSTGIGKSIAFKLARQGLNVVLVALGDPLLDATYEELAQQFPGQEFRKVGNNLHVNPLIRS